MSRYVDIEPYEIDGWYLQKTYCSTYGAGVKTMPLKSVPTAEPVKHGRWIKNEDRSGWHCSCCGKDDLYAYPYTENNERELQDFYCPNCGAKMNK